MVSSMSEKTLPPESSMKVLVDQLSLATERNGTEGAIFASHPAVSTSDKSFDLAATRATSPIDSELAEEPEWIEHLSHRCHPPMQPPSSAKHLTVNTTRNSHTRSVLTASVPVRVDKKKVIVHIDSLTLKPVITKPLHLHLKATVDSKDPEMMRWGRVFWWGLCGGDCTAAVAIVD
jgi:hypothetical protein